MWGHKKSFQTAKKAIPNEFGRGGSGRSSARGRAVEAELQGGAGEGRAEVASTHPCPRTFAGLAVGDGLAEVAVEALLAVVAVPARRVVPAVEAHAATLAP